MSISEKQFAANQANAEKSTGTHSQVHHSLAQARVFAQEQRTLNNLSLYEQRITRNIHKNMKLIMELQDRSRKWVRFFDHAKTNARCPRSTSVEPQLPNRASPLVPDW